MIELLSPAGNKEAFIAAVQAGADAVYMGLNKYNARAMTENFDIDEYIWCINYAHIYNVKVYLTLNILLNDDEIYDALKLVEKLYNNGLDAVILQDIGMASIIKKYIPTLSIHASTQMTVHNLKQAIHLKNFGFDRIVLAREMTIDEIQYIAKNLDVELEIFVHGALCVSYSGQCLMSSMIGQRSGNRGKCAGTCRLKYKLYDKEKFISEGNLLSKKDIFGIEYVKKLVDIGVKSLKIEGRGKTKEYVSLVTRKYRKYLDLKKYSKEDEKDLLQIFNRTSKSFGYLKKVESKDSISYVTPKNTGLFLGKVIDGKDKMVKIKLEEDLSMHDGVEVFKENSKSSTIVTCIRDEKFKLINNDVKKDTIVWIGDFSYLPNKGDILNKTSSKKLLDKENEFLSKIRRKVDVKLDLEIEKDKKIHVTIKSLLDLKNISFKFDYVPQKAINKEITIEDIKQSMSKTQDAFYTLNVDNIKLDKGLFIPISKINELRRIIIEKLLEKSKGNDNVTISNIFIPKSTKNNKLDYKTLFIYKYNEEDIEKYNTKDASYVYLNISDICRNGYEILDKIKNNIYIYIPNIVLNKLERYIDNNLENIVKHKNVKGILLGNIGYLDMCKMLKEKYNLKINIDYTLNVNNIYSANYYIENGADVICVSPEVEKIQIENIKKYVQVEALSDYVTTMTSRFCLVKAFTGACNCTNSKYYTKDSYNNKYYIISDNIDCIMRLVREIPNVQKVENINYRICL